MLHRQPELPRQTPPMPNIVDLDPAALVTGKPLHWPVLALRTPACLMQGAALRRFGPWCRTNQLLSKANSQLVLHLSS